MPFLWMRETSAKMLQRSSNIIKHYYMTKRKSRKTLNKIAKDEYA